MLLERASHWHGVNRTPDKKHDPLKGLTQINLFFEPSTRTQASFELAGKRLGADVINMSVSQSSVNKGETLLDTTRGIDLRARATVVEGGVEMGVSCPHGARSRSAAVPAPRCEPAAAHGRINFRGTVAAAQPTKRRNGKGAQDYRGVCQESPRDGA